MLSIPTANVNSINFETTRRKINKKGMETPVVEKKPSGTNANLMVGATAAATIAFAGLVISNGHKGKHTPVIDPLENCCKPSEEERPAKELEEERIEEDVRRYFEQEEKDAAAFRQEIAKGDERNKEWLQAQHAEKEKEYSDWWNRALKKSDAIKTAMDECKDLTFDSPNLVLMKDKYDGSTTYDLGLRYAIVANNTARAKGTGAIIYELPKMFEGVDQKELISVLDELPSRLESGKFNHFEISGKKYTAREIGGGEINRVYLITDEAGNKICFKHAKDPYFMIAGHGIYNEVAILREANKAGVCDVPKLFMANPVGCRVQRPDSSRTTTKGAWQLVEYIDDTKPINPDSLKFMDWLDSKGLEYNDRKPENRIGEVIVDMGGVMDLAHTIKGVTGNQNVTSNILKAYHNGKTTTEIIDVIDKF